LWYGAAGALIEAIRLDPKLAPRFGRQAAEASYRAGVVFFARRNMDAAATMFRHAVEHQPDFAAARHYLAASYARREHWDDAREVLAELSRLSPDDALLGENRRRVEEKQPLLEPIW
jgi:cytochrome c-type biogenesis protein CcmH/NrfG